MNSAARSNLTETALYLEVYSARMARAKAAGTAYFAAANERVAAAYTALADFRSSTVSVAA